MQSIPMVPKWKHWEECGIFLLALAAFSGSYFYVTDFLRPAALPLCAAGVVGLLLVGAARATKLHKFSIGPVPELFMVWGFLAFGLLSALANGSLELTAGAAFIFALYFSCVSIAGNSGWQKYSMNAFLSSSLVMIVWSLVIARPVSGGSYAGALYNSGVYGSAVSIIASVALAACLTKDGFSRYAYLLLAFVCGVLLAFSRSRGGILAFGMCAIVAVIVWAPTVFKNFRSRMELAVLIVMAPILAWLLWPILVRPVIEKMEYKSEVLGDVTDGRLDIWRWYLSEAALLGGGRAVISPSGFGPHNSFLSVATQYGWIAGTCFIMLFGLLLWRTWFKRKAVGYVPFFACLCFVVLSAFEGMMFKPAMFAAFFFASWALVSSQSTNVSGRPQSNQRARRRGLLGFP